MCESVLSLVKVTSELLYNCHRKTSFINTELPHRDLWIGINNDSQLSMIDLNDMLCYHIPIANMPDFILSGDYVQINEKFSLIGSKTLDTIVALLVFESRSDYAFCFVEIVLSPSGEAPVAIFRQYRKFQIKKEEDLVACSFCSGKDNKVQFFATLEGVGTLKILSSIIRWSATGMVCTGFKSMDVDPFNIEDFQPLVKTD